MYRSSPFRSPYVITCTETVHSVPRMYTCNRRMRQKRHETARSNINVPPPTFGWFLLDNVGINIPVPWILQFFANPGFLGIHLLHRMAAHGESLLPGTPPAAMQRSSFLGKVSDFALPVPPTRIRAYEWKSNGTFDFTGWLMGILIWEMDVDSNLMRKGWLITDP